MRWPTLVAALAIVISAAALPAGLLAADPSPAGSVEPPVAATPQASMSTSDAMCASAADLRTIVGFVQGTDVDADGWIPLFVGVVAGLSEARGLLGLVDDTYRPLVDELVTSLQELFSMTEELRELPTLGSQVAAVGEAITAVGNDMDALFVALREPCPSTT